jgi:DNA (cytosine-5)-methyltransferase 3A
MNVLSLFDGMSGGQIALNKTNIQYDKYYAAEIDKNCIKVTQQNYPNTIQIGDVMGIELDKLEQIELLIAGSPCQSFSSLGDGSGFDGKSGLFWQFVKVLNEIKPKYFLLENVMMKKEWRNIISSQLGVEPIMINSNLLSAQNRKRLYWTNIPNITQPSDKKILIQDIIDIDVQPKYWLSQKSTELLRNKINMDNPPNVACIDVYNKKIKLDNKCPTLTLPHHNSIRMIQNGNIRKLTPNECEKLQTIPINYTDCGISDTQRYSMLGNGWTVDVIAHIFRNIE